MNSGTFLIQSDEFHSNYNRPEPEVQNELENLQMELVDLTHQLETIEQIRNKPRKGIIKLFS